MKKKILLLGLWVVIALQIKAQCPQASFTSTAPACQNTLVDFTNTSGNTGGGWTYFWDFDYPNGGGSNPNTSTSQNPTNIDYSPGGNGVYTVAFTITNSGMGCSSTILIDIDIRKARANFSTSTNIACEGNTVSFLNQGTLGSSPTATVTHNWNFGTGATPSTSNLVNPPSVTYSTPGIKTITHSVVVNYGGCGGTKTDSKTQTIVVNPKPVVTFNTTAPVCEGESVDFTYTGTISAIDQFNWDFGSNASPAMSSAQNPVSVVYGTSGIKTINLTVTNQDGCFNTGTQTITINAKPIASFTSTAPQCTGLAVDFTNTGTTGASYIWNFGSGASPATSSVENPTNVVYSTAGVKTITLIVDNGTCTDTVSNTITIHQTPSVSFTTTAPQCAESGVDLTNTGATGFNWSYNWGLGQDATPATSNSENPVGVTYATGGTKVVTLTIADQFCTSTDTASINIYSLPIANAGVDTTICPNSTVQIGDVNNANYTYSWFPSNSLVLSNPIISNPMATPVASITNYIVTVTETATNCVNIDTAVVTMLSPIIADAGVDVEICRYDSIQLGVGAIENQHYLWTPVNGLTGSTVSNPMVSPDSSITYTVTVTNEYDCPSASDNVTVIVHQLPLIYAGVDDTITIGSSTQLIATGGVQYAWSPIYGLDNSGIYNPIASPDTTINYLVEGIDIYGCINYDTILVTVLAPETWIPNAFTPDDIYNNVLYVRGQGVENFQFRIFNRDGAIIFYSQSMNQGWDGSQQLTHEKLPQGAYVYDIQGVLTDGKSLHESGIVNLIR